MKAPRIMIAAASSGCGKTTITCALLAAFKRRGLKAVSFKCGPDYIDPMFHKTVLGIPSVNLDTYFTDTDTTRYLFAKRTAGADISVLEGVMGYYDGLAGISLQASSYDLAHTIAAPVILVVNAKGMSLSVVSQIAGYLSVPVDLSKENTQAPAGSVSCCGCSLDSHIKGVILNKVSPSLYPELKNLIETNLPVKVLGYLPYDERFHMPSRHLGLVMPHEGDNVLKKIEDISALIEETIDIGGIIKLAGGAPDIYAEMPENISDIIEKNVPLKKNLKIGIALDEAFCFYYEDNLRLLKDLGAQIISFSPLHDTEIPKEADALIFGGGYPELFCGELSENKKFIDSLQKISGKDAAYKIPVIAECGGFMYLHRTMEDDKGITHKTAGLLPGHVRKTEKLVRFGYIELTAERHNILGPAGSSIRGHEFHYYDSTDNGDTYIAKKPLRKRKWSCVISDEYITAGFPHLYYYSNPQSAADLISSIHRI